MKETVLKELLEIKAKVEALIVLIKQESSVTASIEEIRKIALLEEIYRLGGRVTPGQISTIAKKYGKTPSSTAGYYSGKSPSLEACEDDTRRLTEQGESTIVFYRKEWGDDWLERIPLDIVGNPNTRATEIAF